MPTSDLTKVTWKDIKRGAAEPPSDNSDVQASGEASENYTPAHTASDYPPSTANQKQAEVGDKGKLIGYRKAQEHVMKALENPEITKALDILEKAGVFGALDAMEKATDSEETKADEEKADISVADVAKVAEHVVAKALDPLSKKIDSLVKAIGRSEGSDLQKVGFVPVGTTAKPDIGAENKAAPYTKAGEKIMKAASGENVSEAPDFDTLAGTPLHDITRGI